jgi:hypothetical protein
MYKSRVVDTIDWKHHVKQAVKFNGGVYEYSKINNISKSALYRWIKIYSDQINLKIKQKVKKESAFLPVVVTPLKKSQDTHELKLNRELPDSRWVAEIITNVIRGLL